MSDDYKDFVSRWQFRTVLYGSCVAVLGFVLCALGQHFGDGPFLCKAGSVTLYAAGDVAAVFGVVAGALTLAWKWVQRALRGARVR